MATTANNQNNSSVSQFASLYVGDLDPNTTESVLYEVFNSVGAVASIRVCRDAVSRRSLGYAYVNFQNISDAERALNTLNYTPIRGHPCRIMWTQRDPGLRHSGTGNVFVKNLDKSIDNKALFDTFSIFGNILSCKVATDFEGKSRGFGFVHFETEESAKSAIEKLNGMQIGGKIVFVGEFMKNAQRNADGTPKQFTNVYVKHIPESIDEARLSDIFSAYGSITSIHVTTDNKGRRFAFVNFEDFDAAARAVDELHGRDLRTEEEKQLYEDSKASRAEGCEENETEIGDGDVPETQFYVQRAQSKIERQKMLKGKFKTRVGEHKGDEACNLYVKNLAFDVDDVALKNMFSSFGAVTSARVVTDPGTKDSRGFGFVCFSQPEEASKAVTEMHLKLIAGKPLYVGLHEKRGQRHERLQNQFRTQGSMALAGNLTGAGFAPPAMAVSGFPQNGGMFNGGGRGGVPSRGYSASRPAMPFNMMAPQLRGPPPLYGKGKGMHSMNQAVGMGRPNFGVGGRAPPMGMMAPRPQNAMGPPFFDPMQPLTAAGLAAAPSAVQKQMLGEKLFPLVSHIAPEYAGKITGMMLEMDNSELLILLESEQQLRYKVEEAMVVLNNK